MTVIAVDGIDYRVEVLHPDPRVASAAWRFCKLGGRVWAGDLYDVAVMDGCLTCDCKEWLEHRKCPHCAAVIEHGLNK